MIRPALLLIALAGCAEAPEPVIVASRLEVPARLRSCPPGAAAPAPPRAPRTPEQLAEWGIAAEKARARTEVARAECERRLHELAAYARH
ncbi:hypothetical protein RQ831_04045 [Roseomonas gilardii]|uniref:Phosphoribosylamine--glycine ligase n=1 Tax=Roseomonas gilardii TaxID=257708 RepID=A0ABU3MCA1_9PROT|nr:hypothetical protein [Roseomonas gilardii]MDT8330213.1 hypothetical protein [Roseomonas gilardii]